MKTLRNLFLSGLADMYDSERRIADTLPKFIQATSCEKLQSVLQDHADETLGHIKKIERVFSILGQAPQAKECLTMVSILADGQKAVTENRQSSVVQEAIISVCQKVEHYEIASYATLRVCAKSLGNAEATALIDEILNQEQEADRALVELHANINDLEPACVGA